MILGNITQLKEYRNLSSNLERAINYIVENYESFDNMEEGRYLIDDTMYYVISNYSPKPYSGLKLESHKEYIDIQVILMGNEKIGLNYDEEYTPSLKDIENDIYFYDVPIYKIVNLNEDDFVILFPSDLHMPGIVNSEFKVKKLIFKVKI